MIIGSRAPKFPFTLNLFGFDVSKLDYFLGKNSFFEPLPFIAQSKRCIRKFKFEPKALITVSTFSRYAGSPTPQVSYTLQLKEPQTGDSKTTKTSHTCPNVKGFVFSRYKDFIRNCEKALKKTFPAVYKRYRIFNDGISEFYKDIKWYLKIRHTVRNSPEGLRALNLKELDLYMQMPKDIVKLIPTLIGASLPIIGYAICALILIYPHFLTSHFWTSQQRDKFLENELQKRHTNNQLIVRSLKEKLKTVKDPFEYCELANILTMVGYGNSSPTEEEIMKIKDLFAKSPYNLQSLTYRHIKLLCIMHGFPNHFFKRLKLKEHAFLIQHMDYAIQREGGVYNVSLETLKRACAVRGINPVSMSKECLVLWLKKWLAVTTSIQEQHISFLLHLPLFFAFNQPNNCKLYTPVEAGPKTNSL